MTNHANYRKYNDRTHNSSKYHKLDGTPVRHKLKQEAIEEIMEETQDTQVDVIKIAQRLVDQWDHHDKYRVNESSRWTNGVEPDDVALARAYLRLAKYQPMKFNHGELSQEVFVSGWVIVFENGLLLKSESVLWRTEAEQAVVKAKFTEVIELLSSSGSFVYCTEVQA